jgi:hypothetical protein
MHRFEGKHSCVIKLNIANKYVLFRILFPDDGGSTHLWNVGRQLFYTVVHPTRQFWTSYSPPWELEISQICFMCKYSSKKQGCLGKIGTPVNATCQENLLACHFGHTCHRFVSRSVGYRLAFCSEIHSHTHRHLFCGSPVLDFINTNNYAIDGGKKKLIEASL